MTQLRMERPLVLTATEQGPAAGCRTCRVDMPAGCRVDMPAGCRYVLQQGENLQGRICLQGADRVVMKESSGHGINASVMLHTI